MNPTNIDSKNVKTPSKMMLVGEVLLADSTQAITHIITIVPIAGIIKS